MKRMFYALKFRVVGVWGYQEKVNFNQRTSENLIHPKT